MSTALSNLRTDAEFYAMVSADYQALCESVDSARQEVTSRLAMLERSLAGVEGSAPVLVEISAGQCLLIERQSNAKVACVRPLPILGGGLAKSYRDACEQALTRIDQVREATLTAAELMSEIAVVRSLLQSAVQP